MTRSAGSSIDGGSPPFRQIDPVNVKVLFCGSRALLQDASLVRDRLHNYQCLVIHQHDLAGAEPLRALAKGHVLPTTEEASALQTRG